MTTRRFVSILLAALLALSATVSVASAADGPTCAPGQHGNPHPGFKPGPCPPNT